MALPRTMPTAPAWADADARPSEALLDRVRPEIRALKPYTVATDTDGAAKLDQNESPFDLPADLKRALLERVAAYEWNRYPQDRPHRLTRALAERLGVTPEQVLVGHGSNEITHTLGLVFLRTGTPVVLPHPMFSLYESVARMHGADLHAVDPEPDFTHDADAILAAAQRADAALTVVTTPNNPTGKGLSLADLTRLARGVPGFLLIDEAYFEFIDGPTAIDLLPHYPNVLVLRTFSKAMGLAGLRLGYLVAHPHVIREIEKARIPFLVDRLAEETALLLLERPDLIAERVALLKAERAQLQAAVRALGVEAHDSQANFFLMRTPLAAADLQARLLAEGVRVRNVSSYRALPRFVRVSVGTPDENRTFLVALKRVLAEAGVGGA